jgi:(p)ppGpp synthase/HD superfamily hydrolase
VGQSEGRRPPDLGPRFDQALVLASELHRRQERKGRGTPYVSHLLAVCSIVLDNGGDEDEAIAALLHDSAEDQGGQATLDMIEARFGPRVARIVAACSETFERPRPPALERKRAYLARPDRDGTSRSVILVSAADKVHNLRSTLDDYDEIGPVLWRRFKLSPSEPLWYYRSLSDIYDRRLGGPMAKALNEMVDKLAIAAGPVDDAGAVTPST